MFKRSIGLITLVGLGIVTSAPQAIARDASEVAHAATCNPKRDLDIAPIQYSQFGVHNTSSTDTAYVECGFESTVEANNVFWAIVYDRSPTENVCCTVTLLSNAPSGDAVFTGQACSSNVGTNTQTLVVNIPSVGSGFASVECSLPHADPTNGFSHVVSFLLG